MQMNVSEAKAKLLELIAAAERGEEVIISRSGHPVVKLVPVARPTTFRIGLAEGQVCHVPDFLEPMPEEEPELWG